MKPAESRAPCVPQILQKLSLTKKRAGLWVPPKEKPVPQAGSERCSKFWPVLVIVPMARMLQPHAGEMLPMTEFRQKGRSTFGVWAFGIWRSEFGRAIRQGRADTWQPDSKSAYLYIHA